MSSTVPTAIAASGSEPRRRRSERIVVRGGRPLDGDVKISAARGAVLPILAAALLSDSPVTLRNVPHLREATSAFERFARMGVDLLLDERMSVRIDGATLREPSPPRDAPASSPVAFALLAPLLVRFGHARVALPLARSVGWSRMSMLIHALVQMGARVRIERGMIDVRARCLSGVRVALESRSASTTAALMTTATRARGITVIENAAREPEVVDLARFLASMGAGISGHGTDTIEIRGVPRLRGAVHEVPPDRFETGALAIAAAITGGRIGIVSGRPASSAAVLDLIEDSGPIVYREANRIEIDARGCRPRALRARVGSYPAVPADMQGALTSLNAISDGIGRVSPADPPTGLTHVGALRRMGADVEIRRGCAVSRGVAHLEAAPVTASGLHGVTALVLAALAARGETEIECIGPVDETFERIEEKLTRLGARIRRERDDARACSR